MAADVIAAQDTAQAQRAAAAAAEAQQAQERYRPTTLSIEQVNALLDAAPSPEDLRERLDHAHDATFAWAQRRVAQLDRSFADEDKPLQAVPVAPFRVGLVGGWVRREAGTNFDLQSTFDITLRLPNIEERLGLFVTSGELDEAFEDDQGGSRLRAGLRYELLRYLDFDLGIRVDVPPVPFVSLKWAREIPLGKWSLFPLAKLFAETQQSVGVAAGLTLDRWSGRHLLRASTYAKWRADLDRTQWSETILYARTHQLIVPDRYGSYLRANDIGSGWGLRLLAAGETASTVDQYEAGIFYRRPTRSRWLYWSVEPMLRWDRQYAWSADPGIRLGIQMLFWDLARPARQ